MQHLASTLRPLLFVALMSIVGCPTGGADDDDAANDDDSACTRCACGVPGATLTVVSGCSDTWWPEATTCDGGWADLLEDEGLAVGDDFCSGSSLANTGAYPCEIEITCD